jgi:hypothetical protein|tara:strand:+ start:667 stop:903 length:237 start_codon:yes stop_codon:yes gene_type:complete
MIEYLRVFFAPYTGYRRVEPVEASVTKESWDHEFASNQQDNIHKHNDTEIKNISQETSGSKREYHGPEGVGEVLSIWV